MTKRRFALPLLLASAVGIAQAGCGGQPPGGVSEGNTPAEAAKVLVTKVLPGNLRRTIELPMTVEGYETARLMSKIDGYVAQVHVDIGDEVRQGQTLAVLSAPEREDEVERRQRLVLQAEADLKSRQAEISLAEARLEEQKSLLKLRNIELERASNLVNKEALKQQKLDEAEYAMQSTQAAIKSGEAAVEAAQAALASATAHRGVALAELQKAKSMAAYRTISAPFDGVITRRMVDPGAFVRPATNSAATPLFDIARNDKVRLVVFLPMDQAGALTIGDEVTIDSIEGWPAAGIDQIGGKPITVSHYANSFDTDSRMMRAEIDVDNQELNAVTGRQLKPGNYGKVTVTLETYDGIPTVPTTALGSNNGSSFIFVVDSTGTCLKTRVKVQIVNGNVAGLVGGGAGSVKIGDEIVADGIDRVKDEQKLTSGAKQFFDFNPSP